MKKHIMIVISLSGISIAAVEKKQNSIIVFKDPILFDHNTEFPKGVLAVTTQWVGSFFKTNGDERQTIVKNQQKASWNFATIGCFICCCPCITATVGHNRIKNSKMSQNSSQS